MEIKTNYFLFSKRKEILILIMRLFIILFCTTVFSFTPKNMFSQDVKINIKEDKTITVDEVFDIIKTQTNYNFAYKANIFDDAPKVTLKKGIINAHDLLIKSLSFANLSYELTSNRIIVFKEKKTSTFQQTISGLVTDKDNFPLSGVSVQIEGTITGVLTDFDGRYRIPASEGHTLIFKYLGKKDFKVTVENSTTINIVLEDSIENLNEVVITALGIRKEKKAIGYAVSTVKSDLIENRTEGDLARVLSGKVAGLQVTNSSGLSGSGTNVIIRGFTSFTGSNQALFVVDGVPFNNDIVQASGGFFNNNQATNRAFDIDPNDIVKVEVLKGLAAATLYGAEGSNGVILITTKSGSGGAGVKPSITISQSTFINAIATKPDYQNEYGQGDNGVFNINSLNSWGPSYKKDGPLGWGINNPNIDENGTYAHPVSTSNVGVVREAFPQFQDARVAYRPHNSFDDFFKPGIINSTNISATGNSTDGNTSFSVNLGYLADDSFMPGNATKRTNVSVGGSTKISNKLTATGSLRYSITDHNTPRGSFDFSGTSNRGGVYGLILSNPRSIDLNNLPYQNTINNFNVSYRQSNNLNNPLWLAKNLNYNQKTNRTFWRLEFDYEINDNLSLKWRSGNDFYNSKNTNTINRGGILFQGTGSLEIRNNITNNWNHLLSLSGNYKLIDKLGLSFIIGGNSESFNSENVAYSFDDQIAYNVFNQSNFRSTDPKLSTFISKRNQVGVFGQTTIDYDNFLYLNVSARSDWVSNLQAGFNNAIYPSTSLSFLPTEVFDWMKSDTKGLNYLKLRTGYGTSTRFPGGYPIDAGIFQSNDTNFGTVLQSLTGDADEKIIPEIIKEWEIGFEAKFFNNRGSIDFSYFDRRTDDIISFQPVAPTTGNLSQIQTNTGNSEASGVEIALSFDVIKNKNLTWNSSVNFFSHNETLLERSEKSTQFGNNIPFAFGDFANIGSNAAIVGESLGAIVGTKILRNEDGVPIISAAGHYQIDSRQEDGTPHIVGDAIADYSMNFYNSVSYKNWVFSFMIHHTKGGDIFTQIPSILLGKGLIKDNLHEHGNTIVVQGVTETGEPNDVQVSPQSYWRNSVNLIGPTETKVYDASIIRLQELSFGYNFPSKWLEKTPFTALSFTATGNNLWHSAYNIPKGTNLDTNTSGPGPGNNRGIDYSNSPGSRRYGITLKATF